MFPNFLENVSGIPLNSRYLDTVIYKITKNLKVTVSAGVIISYADDMVKKFLDFREECEELRAEESKRRRDQIFADRKEQIKIKKGRELNEAELENFFAKLWEEDTKANALREEFETQQQIERNRSALEVLKSYLLFLFVNLGSITLKVPTSQNGQTHPSNSSAAADELTRLAFEL